MSRPLRLTLALFALAIVVIAVIAENAAPNAAAPNADAAKAAAAKFAAKRGSSFFEMMKQKKGSNGLQNNQVRLSAMDRLTQDKPMLDIDVTDKDITNYPSFRKVLENFKAGKITKESRQYQHMATVVSRGARNFQGMTSKFAHKDAKVETDAAAQNAARNAAQANREVKFVPHQHQFKSFNEFKQAYAAKAAAAPKAAAPVADAVDAAPADQA